MTKLIDTHFHLDMYKNHKEIFVYLNQKKIYTLCMTNSPGVFISCNQLYSEGKYVRFAIGFHPLNFRLTDKDLDDFFWLLPSVDYVGEIGLDFSNKKCLPKERQMIYFERIVERCAILNKLMSIHVRKAEAEVIKILEKYMPRRIIIHWFSGSESELKMFLKLGCYFSINANMVLSNLKIVKHIPRDKILIESDGPYSRINGIKYKPELLSKEYEIISNKLNEPELTSIVFQNFKRLLMIK